MIGLRETPNFLYFLICLSKALTPLVPILHVQKFLMVGVNSREEGGRGSGPGPKFLGSPYFCEKSLHTKFGTSRGFPSIRKACGGWVVVVCEVDFSVRLRLNKNWVGGGV